MNFVGKVLVVVQVVLSLCFMAFAGAVYSVQTSWKERAERSAAELQTARSNWNLEKENLDQRVRDAETERDQAQVAARASSADAQTRQQRVAQLENELKTARQELEQQRALAVIAGTEAAMRKEEAENQRLENRKLHDTRNELIATVRRQEDQIFTEEITRQRYTQRHRQLLDDHGVLKSILRSHGLSGDPKDYASLQAPPPEIAVHVLNTRRESRSGVEYVEISGGSDDGLVKGHDVFIYRNNGRPEYLGKANIVYVTPDRAVGTVTERARNGVIQKGDHVTTKL